MWWTGEEEHTRVQCAQVRAARWSVRISLLLVSALCTFEFPENIGGIYIHKEQGKSRKFWNSFLHEFLSLATTINLIILFRGVNTVCLAGLA